MTNPTQIIRGDLKVEGQSSSPVYTQAYSSSITIDWDNGPKQAVTLTGDPEFQTTLNAKDGASYVLYVIQDGTGGHDPTFADQYWLFEGEAWPTWSNGANAIDILYIEVKGLYLHVRHGLNFKRYIPA